MTSTPLTPKQEADRRRASITVFQHNNTSYSLTGNWFAVDNVRRAVIQDSLTKGLALYLQNDEVETGWEKVEQLNYASIKSLRGHHG